MSIQDSKGNLHSVENGQFIPKNGGDTSTPAEKKRAREILDEKPVEDIASLLGEEFVGFKGQEAIQKLMTEQRGHVKGAFVREDIGGIDLLWGDDTFGLQHIIKRRTEQGVDVTAFLSGLTDVVEKGEVIKKNEGGKFELWYDGKKAVISPELRDNKITFLLTAFNQKTKK